MEEEREFTTEEITLGQSLQSASLVNAMTERKVEELLLSKMTSPSDLSNPAIGEMYNRTMSFSRELNDYSSKILRLSSKIKEEFPELLNRKITVKLLIDERFTPFDKNLWHHLFKLAAGGDDLKNLLRDESIPESAIDTVSETIENVGLVCNIIRTAIDDGIFGPK